jgi:hypothetical protein
MFEDEDEFGVDITGQHHVLLRIEMIDAGYSAKAIEEVFRQCDPSVLSIVGSVAASMSQTKQSFAALISDKSLFFQQATEASEHQNPVVQATGEALLSLHSALLG